MELKEKLKIGDKIEVEIMPLSGQYKATTVDGTPFVEKFSVEAGELIVENWKKDGSKDILCDIDHSSVDTNDTAAAGWVSELRVDKEALRLKGMLTVSEKGADLLNGIEYRYLSPVLLFTEDEMPYYLDSVSLTNTPRLQELKAVYNSRGMVNSTEDLEKMDTEEVKEEVSEEVKEEIQNPEETPVEEVKEEVKEEVEEPIEEPKSDFIVEVKGILGLPDEATEEDVKASITEIVEKLRAIADEEITEEAVEAVNECGIEEEKREEVVNAYKRNPELVKTVLNCFKKTPVKMVVNSEEAVKPELTSTEKLMEEVKNLPGGQARVDFLLKNRK